MMAQNPQLKTLAEIEASAVSIPATVVKLPASGRPGYSTSHLSYNVGALSDLLTEAGFNAQDTVSMRLQYIASGGDREDRIVESVGIAASGERLVLECDPHSSSYLERLLQSVPPHHPVKLIVRYSCLRYLEPVA